VVTGVVFRKEDMEDAGCIPARMGRYQSVSPTFTWLSGQVLLKPFLFFTILLVDVICFFLLSV